MAAIRPGVARAPCRDMAASLLAGPLPRSLKVGQVDPDFIMAFFIGSKMKEIPRHHTPTFQSAMGARLPVVPGIGRTPQSPGFNRPSGSRGYGYIRSSALAIMPGFQGRLRGLERGRDS